MERHKLHFNWFIWLSVVVCCTADIGLLQEKNMLEIARDISLKYPDVVNTAVKQIWQVAYPSGDMLDVPVVENVFADDNTTYCETCTVIVAALKAAFLTSYPAAERLFITLCGNITTLLGNKPEPLCTGTLKLQLPSVRAVLISINPTVSNLEVCEFTNLCIPPNPAVVSINSQTAGQSLLYNAKDTKMASSSWNDGTTNHVQRRQKSMFASSGAITVLQLTDFHVEPYYELNSPTDCGLPVCCQNKWGGTGLASRLGEFTCNIPQSTMELFLTKVDAMNPDIVFFGGDAPPHTVWEETYQSQLNCTRSLVDTIARKFSPGRRVYPIIGNHEMYPTNVFSMWKLSDTQNFVNEYANLWGPIANFEEEQMTTIRAAGYYSIIVRPRLRILAFNTNYMYTFNWYNAINHKTTGTGNRLEVQKMKQFMIDTLQNATVNNEKVILIGHHPPGGSDYIVAGGSRWYQELVRNYSDVIVLQPTGHTHIDEFRLINNSAGEPVSMVYVSPSMDSHGMKNPSMRVYYLNETTYEVLDYEQYFLNIIKVKDTGTLSVDETEMIKLLYSARREYILNDLSPRSWLDLLNRFRTDRAMLTFHRSHSNANSQSDLTYHTCSVTCRETYICRMLHADYDLYNQCVADIPPTPDSTTPFPPATPSPNSSSTIFWNTWIVALCYILE